jgi:hypothetical protein
MRLSGVFPSDTHGGALVDDTERCPPRIRVG